MKKHLPQQILDLFRKKRFYLKHRDFKKFDINISLELSGGIVKFKSQIAWKQIFTTFLTLVWDILDVGIIANAKF